jgi:hypothetical protein
MHKQASPTSHNFALLTSVLECFEVTTYMAIEKALWHFGGTCHLHCLFKATNTSEMYIFSKHLSIIIWDQQNNTHVMSVHCLEMNFIPKDAGSKYPVDTVLWPKQSVLWCNILFLPWELGGKLKFFRAWSIDDKQNIQFTLNSFLCSFTMWQVLN